MHANACICIMYNTDVHTIVKIRLIHKSVKPLYIYVYYDAMYCTSLAISSYNAITAAQVICGSLGAKQFSTITVKYSQKLIQVVELPV